MLSEFVGNFPAVYDKAVFGNSFYKISKNFFVFRFGFKIVRMVELDIGQDDTERRVGFEFVFVFVGFKYKPLAGGHLVQHLLTSWTSQCKYRSKNVSQHVGGRGFAMTATNSNRLEFS